MEPTIDPQNLLRSAQDGLDAIAAGILLDGASGAGVRLRKGSGYCSLTRTELHILCTLVDKLKKREAAG